MNHGKHYAEKRIPKHGKDKFSFTNMVGLDDDGKNNDHKLNERL